MPMLYKYSYAVKCDDSFILSCFSITFHCVDIPEFIHSKDDEYLGFGGFDGLGLKCHLWYLNK